MNWNDKNSSATQLNSHSRFSSVALYASLGMIGTGFAAGFRNELQDYSER